MTVGKEGGFKDYLENLFPDIKIVAPDSNILCDIAIEMNSNDDIVKVDYFRIGGVGSNYSANF